MKIGINTLLWTAGFDRSHLPLLSRFKGWGFDGVEIARFDYSDFPAAEVGRAVRDSGLEPIACSALTGQLSLISEDAGIRTKARDFLLGAIEAAANLGADTLVGPYVSPVGYLCGRRRTADEWKRAVDELSSLGPALDQHGVTLAIEPLNRFETFSLNTAADAARLIDEIGHPRIGVLFDTFHAHIEEKSMGGAVESLGSRTRHIHTCENDRGIPGSGQVDWDGLFSAIKTTGYDRWLVIESFGSAIPEIAAAACIWRDLAPESDLIAIDGIRFLRSRV